MKIPLNWLAECVDTKGLSAKQISDGLRLSGTENMLEETASFESFVVGEIKELAKHPDADKLQVAQVDVGKKNGGVLQIVCGASNIKAGQKVPVALSGARFGDFKIKKVKLRGVESNGMMCSEKELELGDDHEGIMILESSAKVGTPLAVHLGGTEPVLDAEITPNRGDCLSVIGMSREVAATFSRKLKKPNVEIPEVKTKKKIKVEVKDKDLCPRYIAKVVTGVKIGPSPKWMQEKLLAAGVRPINNVVDVTNYVMLEWGQPLHAFDARKIKEKIVVRRAKKGETIKTLDEVTHKLEKDDLLICDGRGPVALAGIMGGANSEISDDTTEVILEAAVFDRVAVRKTAHRLANRTEASNRFEKGVPLGLPEIAIERAAHLLTEIPGGLAGEMPVVKPQAGEKTDILSSWIWVQHVGLRLSRIKEVLGVDVSEKQVLQILADLGFRAEKFDFKKEARKHVGKPYVWGAKFKTHGDMAFDCSYLTDYMYSLIGKFIGYVCLGQYELGTPVKEEELRPGDILFVRGKIEHSPVDHYFTPDGKGGYNRVDLESPKEIGHEGIYIGGGRVVHAREHIYDAKAKKWVKAKNAEVVEDDVEVFTKNPEYLGARRYLDDPDAYLAVTAPWWRLDIAIEEDLIEEIGRIYGYNKLPATLPAGPLPLPTKNKKLDLIQELKTRLVGAGYTETMTYSFVSAAQIKLTGDQGQAPKIVNPLSEENEYMRSNLAVSLLSVAEKNQENFEEIRIFEVANVYTKDSQESRLGLLIKSGQKNEAVDFYKLKGAVDLFLRRLDLEDVSLKVAKESKYFAHNQSAEILINKKRVGYLGVVDNKIQQKLGLKTPAAVCEIFIDALLPYYGKVKTYKPLPKYPRSVRDIDVIFDQEVLVGDIVKALGAVKDKNLFDFNVLDVYQGKGLAENKKSVTIRLIIGSEEKTLTEEAISSCVQASLGALSKLGGKLRS